MKKKTLLLIDTFGLLYKLYYTLPPHMKTPDGTPVNAAFGFARLLLKIHSDIKPDYLVAAMESRTTTFRHEEYDQYKAHRDKMPDDLRVQLPIVEKLIDAVGLKPAWKNMYEADDIIGTLCRTGAEKGLEVSAITGDKDLLQLVDDNVRILMSIKGVTELESFDREKVKETMGVYPEQIPDKKGLEGDSSDNIPGVPGVGEKTANKLLEQFKTIEEIYESLDAVESKTVRKKLEENRDLADLSKRLATIVKDVELDYDLEDFRFGDFDKKALAELFTEYAFDSLLKELGEEAAGEVRESRGVAAQLSSKYRLVSGEEELREFLAVARARGRLCIDLETMGLNPFTDPIVGYSLAVEPGEAIYVPVRHEWGAPAPSGDMFEEEKPDAACDVDVKQLTPERALEIMKPFIEDPEIELLGHNLKFDLLMIRSAGSFFGKVGYDSFLAAYLIDPASRRYALKPLAGHILNIRMKSYEDVAGSGKEQVPFSRVPPDAALDYACADVDTVLRIAPALTKSMEEKELLDIFYKIEVPLVPVLAEMEWNGISIDSNGLKELSIVLERKEDDIRAEIRRLTDSDVNPKSPKQVAELLFDQLGLPQMQKRSTDVSVLEKLAGSHDVVPLIMEFRHLSKLRGTYVDALPEAVNPQTKRIHTSFNQTLTATGRLSSSRPNLQNIPIRTEEGRRIRRMFVPGSDSELFISADYSQVEVRILAHMSGDPALIKSFENREDIHTRTAAAVFGLAPEEVNADQRRYAKSINFGIIYGKTEYGLAQELRISRHEAGEFIGKYFERYPKIKDFIEATKEESARDGYVTTLFGRRRYIEEVTSRNRMQQEAGFRAAVNARIQGTAADIMKMAMIRIYNMIQAGELDARMLLQVHDELVFEVDKGRIEQEAAKIKHAMEHATDGWTELSVSLDTDVKAGPNWLDMEPVEL